MMRARINLGGTFWWRDPRVALAASQPGTGDRPAVRAAIRRDRPRWERRDGRAATRRVGLGRGRPQRRARRRSRDARIARSCSSRSSRSMPSGARPAAARCSTSSRPSWQTTTTRRTGRPPARSGGGGRRRRRPGAGVRPVDGGGRPSAGSTARRPLRGPAARQPGNAGRRACARRSTATSRAPSTAPPWSWSGDDAGSTCCA